MDGCAFLFKQLRHRRIGVFHKPLLGQANFAQKFFNSALAIFSTISGVYRFRGLRRVNLSLFGNGSLVHLVW